MRSLLARAIGVVGRLVPTSALRRGGRRLYSTRAGRVLLRRLYRAMAEQPHVIRKGPLSGLKIATAGANAGYALGLKEPYVQSEMARLLRSGMTVYDIGANVGFFTIQAARLVGPMGVVVAFEPLSENLAPLRRNIALNDFSNVEVLEVAIGAHDGTSSMAEGSSGLGGSTARLATEIDAPGQRVCVRTLDSLREANAVRPPDVVKIDVEGTEVDVVLGMCGLLAQYHPVILCEVHDTPGDAWREDKLTAIFTQAGYVIRRLEDEDAGGMPHIVATHPSRVATKAP